MPRVPLHEEHGHPRVRGRFLTKTLVAALLVALALPSIGAAAAAGVQEAPVDRVAQQLERQKLREEIRKLQLENRNERGVRGFFSSYSGSLTALLTVLVAIGGLMLTVRQQTRERVRQQDQDRQQRDRDREQRDVESSRHLDERFTSILTDLGATSEAVQAGAAISLLSFLRPEHAAYHRQIRLAALANLKVAHPPAVTRILTHVLEGAFRTADALETVERDLSRAELERIDLSELDLTEADLAFANLRSANLNNAILTRARGFGVELENARLSGDKTDLEAARLREAKGAGALFHNARLVSAHFERAILPGAEFQGAQLQAAHFEGADLRGAKFERAILSDTRFVSREEGKAQLDESALRSISRAIDWEKAHFAPEHKQRVRELRARTDDASDGD